MKQKELTKQIRQNTSVVNNTLAELLSIEKVKELLEEETTKLPDV